MLAPLTPFALASSANSRFQASKPAAVLPHCAASAVAPRHANTANAARATINVLPWIIQTPFAPFGLGRLALRLLGGRFLAGLLACDRHQHFLLAACRLPGLLRRLRGLSRLGTANAPAQRLHQVHDIASSGTVLVRDRLAGALLEVDQRCFVLSSNFSGSNRPDFWLTMCLARSSMSLVTLTSWISSKYSPSARTSYGSAAACPSVPFLGVRAR